MHGNTFYRNQIYQFVLTIFFKIIKCKILLIVFFKRWPFALQILLATTTIAVIRIKKVKQRLTSTWNISTNILKTPNHPIYKLTKPKYTHRTSNHHPIHPQTSTIRNHRQHISMVLDYASAAKIGRMHRMGAFELDWILKLMQCWWARLIDPIPRELPWIGLDEKWILILIYDAEIPGAGVCWWVLCKGCLIFFLFWF